MMFIPTYWHVATKFICNKDPILRKIITKNPSLTFVKSNNSFQSLARSIIGQQISTVAAKSIWGKINQNIIITPSKITKTRNEKLRLLGISSRKIVYLKDLSHHYLDDKINDNFFNSASDEEIISRLIQIKGIGIWTAQMFLMFFLFRPNVFPSQDLSIKKAMLTLYKKKNASEIIKKSEEWQPWKSVATFYLWKYKD